MDAANKEMKLAATSASSKENKMRTSLFAFAIGFTVFAFIAFSAVACGNNTSAEDAGEPQTMNPDNHQGHDMEKAPAPEKASTNVKNGFDGMPASGTKATCPVMGNDFEVTSKTEYSEYKGKTYVFCCPGCKPAFEADPEKYIKKL